MNPNSPHYLFDPVSPGWLKRRVGTGEHFSKADVVRVVGSNPECHFDPVVAGLMRKALLGELPARRGRKRTARQDLKELYALALYDDLVLRLVERRKRQRAKGIRKLRGHYSATELAHAVVARRVGMATPEAMRNLVSSQKKARIS